MKTDPAKINYFSETEIEAIKLSNRSMDYVVQLNNEIEKDDKLAVLNSGQILALAMASLSIIRMINERVNRDMTLELKIELERIKFLMNKKDRMNLTGDKVDSS